MVEVYPSSYAYNGVSSIPEDSPVNDVSRVAAATVAARVLMEANVASRPENNKMTREEHAAMMQELSRKRAGWRTPRRGWSSTDAPVDPRSVMTANYNPVLTSQQPQSGTSTGHQHRPLPDRSHSRHAPPAQSPLAAQQQAARRPHETQPTSPRQQRGPRPRPPMPAPRRSYSVTDHEPMNQTHPPSLHMAITDLPPELHYAIFDFLDPIDSTCLGLANRHFYDIHRRMHGAVPLSSRRDGPNDLEWAWRGAGPLVHPQPAAAVAPPRSKLQQTRETGSEDGASKPDHTTPGAALQEEEQQQQQQMLQGPALESLRVKGQVYCRKCGISRCELHRHLKEWMASAGKRYEYCSVSCRYGPPAPGGAKEFCHLKSPKRPHRCGRHAAPAQGKSGAASGAQTPLAQEAVQTPSATA